MRQAREIIRLKAASVSAHEISRRLGMPRSTVREALERAEGAGLSWPLTEGVNDDALEAALYANRRSKRGHRQTFYSLAEVNAAIGEMLKNLNEERRIRRLGVTANCSTGSTARR